jgi:spermidine synthase
MQSIQQRALQSLVIEQDNATGRVSFWERDTHHSAADKNGISLGEYIHAIYGLLRQAKARDVLMLGCGGGTLATMLHRAGAKVTVVDIDPRALEIARAYFHMPPSIACHVDDAARFLRRARHRYDAIVLDAYGDSGLPRHLATPAFFRLAKSRMTARGAVFAANLMVADDDDPAPLRVTAAMRKVWRCLRLLDAEGWDDRNAIALAGAVRALKRPRLLMPPRRNARKLAAGLKTLKFRRLPA